MNDTTPGPAPSAGSVPFQLTDKEVTLIWSLPEQELPATQKAMLPALRRWLRRAAKHNPLAGYLVGESVNTLESSHVQALTADALIRFRPQKVGVSAVRLLGKVIDCGNEQGAFSLCPPAAPLVLQRTASPFAPERWPALEIGPNLRTLLVRDILSPRTLSRSKTPPINVARMALGQCLLSAIVHGGMIHRDLLDALARRLHEGNPVLDCLGERVFVELSLDWRKQTNAEFRRWFPDDLSAILLMNLTPEVIRLALPMSEDEARGALQKAIWRCIRAYLRHAGTRREAPRSLASLLDAVRLDLETRLPIALVAYASRSFVSHSLKPAVWRRLHGVACAPMNEMNAQTGAAIAPPGTGLRHDVEDTEEPEPRWLHALRAALRGTDRGAIVTRVDALLETGADSFMPGQIGELFAGFARRMFLTCNDNKVRLGLRTARAYAISAAKRLGGLAGTEDISVFGSEEWVALYEEALSDAETERGQRRKVVRVLREFQRYLELERDAEPIDAAEIFGTEDGLVPVDANLVSHEEFLRIRERFAQSVADEIHPDLAEIGWLILTLAYRCGLRRMEALKLELDDLLIEAPAELLVRPTAARRLKTKSSTRKIPLYALLDPDELDRMRAWLDRRRRMERTAAYSRFLFALPEKGFLFVPQDTLFKLLHRVMREVTGDDTLRFHHLRHAFATCCFITLAASKLNKPANLIGMLPGFEPILADSAEFRQRLYGNSRMTRRDIWAVSSLLGHSGPDVSLEHYIHLLDLALAENMDRPELAPNISAVITASGQSIAQGYRHRDEGTLHAWVAHLWHKRYSHPTDRKHTAETRYGEKVKSGSTAEPAVHAHQADSLLRIWRLLLIHDTRQQSIDDLSMRHGVDTQLIERYVSNARWLHGMTMSPNGKTHRHRFMSWVPDKRQPKQSRRILCPVKPHERRDQRIIVSLVPKLREAFQTDRALVMRVLTHYAEHARPDFAGMIFTDPDNPQPARDFLALLKMLGMGRRDIRFISYDVTAKRSKWSAAWKRELGMRTAEVMDKLAPPNGRKDWACPWLGIEPVFPDETGSLSGAVAFRFCLVMAIIAARGK
jgi:integrase